MPSWRIAYVIPRERLPVDLSASFICRSACSDEVTLSFAHFEAVADSGSMELGRTTNQTTYGSYKANVGGSSPTHERIFSPPTPLPKALEQVAAWLESPTLVVLAETAGYWGVLARVVERAKITGPRLHDGRVAALCLHHGVRELLSADRDFTRFSDLKTRNPLVAP